MGDSKGTTREPNGARRRQDARGDVEGGKGLLGEMARRSSEILAGTFARGKRVVGNEDFEVREIHEKNQGN